MNAKRLKQQRRKGAGRKARVEKRKSDSPSSAIRGGFVGGQYKPLSRSDMDKIHRGALKILATTGIGDATPELLDIVSSKGCTLNEHGRLCFPEAMMEDLIAGAALEYTVCGRGDRFGKDDIHCAGNKVYFSNQTFDDIIGKEENPEVPKSIL